MAEAVNQGPTDAAWPRRPLVIRIGKKLRPLADRLIARFSSIPVSPLLDPPLFPWVATLEDRWTVIRDEAHSVLRHQAAIPPLNQISPDHARIAGDGRWRSFFLYGYGHRIEENCRRCPATAAMVDRLPGLNSAFFSILEPGAHIPRHRGVTKGIFTAHLGLVVPQHGDACRMQVGPETVRWHEGKMLIFDDTYPHEVWNDTGETRVVLLLQLQRPLRLPGAIVSSLFLGGIKRSAFVKDATANLGDWELAYRRMEMNEDSRAV